MSRYGLIGYPIGHSSSPDLFRAAYDGELAYDLIPAQTFEEAWKMFVDGYDAVNVTAPFKREAFLKADIRTPEAEKCSAANILVKTPGGILAHNSDYLAVRYILSAILAVSRNPELPEGSGTTLRTVAVIGTGGAGRAAKAAAEDLGLEVSVYRHTEIESGVESDIIVYTLPSAVPGVEKLRCRVLLEANYKDPCLKGRRDFQYIGGKLWLREQARLGYGLMTGRTPKAGVVAVGGFMGSGKTTVGRKLAEFSGRRFVDLDDEVEKAAEKSIADIFKTEGESYFRRLELECLKKAVSQDGIVLALGGGTFTISEAKSVLFNTEFVYLQTDFETVAERLSRDKGRKRPLYDPETLEALYNERQVLLNECIDSLQ